MKNNSFIQGVAAAVTLVLAVLVLNPFDVWMPTAMSMALLASLFIIFCLFAVFVIKEGASDEREAQHKTSAGRAAFLAGAMVLVVGIVAGDINHALDPWLVAALAAMVAAKFGARWYHDMWG